MISCTCAEWIPAHFLSTDVLNAFVFILALSVDFLSFAESCCVLTHLWFHQFEFNDIRVESNTYCNWEQQHAQAKTVPFFFSSSSHLFVCSLHVLISLLPFHNSSKKTIKTNHWCFVSLCYPTNILIRCSVKPLIFFIAGAAVVGGDAVSGLLIAAYVGLCIGMRWIDVNQNHKVNIKSCKVKWRRIG